MSGIIGGEIVLLGLIALPQMLRLGYDRKLAIGVVCAGGALGTMIPPSIVLIIYGLTANVSIGDLFTASFVSGVTAASAAAYSASLTKSVRAVKVALSKRFVSTKSASSPLLPTSWMICATRSRVAGSGMARRFRRRTNGT